MSGWARWMIGWVRWMIGWVRCCASKIVLDSVSTKLKATGWLRISSCFLVQRYSYFCSPCAASPCSACIHCVVFQFKLTKNAKSRIANERKLSFQIRNVFRLSNTCFFLFHTLPFKVKSKFYKQAVCLYVCLLSLLSISRNFSFSRRIPSTFSKVHFKFKAKFSSHAM